MLLESLAGNHALVDGNKRLSWLSLVVRYGLNASTWMHPTTTPTNS